MAEPEIPDMPDDDVLAAELALGVLEGDERATALRRALAEPAFSARVEMWRTRLATLLDTLPAVDPPDAVWEAIEADIQPGASRTVGRWRAVAAAMTAIAAVLAVLLVSRDAVPVAPSTERRLIVQLNNETGQPLLVAEYRSDTGEMRVRTSNLQQGALRPELWVIGADAKPQSLGLIALNDVSAFEPSQALRQALVRDSVIALTMEPADGAPHAAPTGEILSTAKLSIL